MLGGLSLRARLVLGVIVLAAIGLAAAEVATYASLRSFLLDRTDETLQEAHFGIEHELRGGRCPQSGSRPLPGASPGDYVELRGADGSVLCSDQAPSPSGATSPPRLPPTVDVPAGAGPDRAVYLTVPAEDDGGRYRVRASREPLSDTTLFVATSLEDVDATLRRLVVIELLVTVAVLAALAALALWVVRLGLRPLAQIEQTAAAIGAGDCPNGSSAPSRAPRWAGWDWR
jgi:two-component system, OmpR family, sensor kinase